MSPEDAWYRGLGTELASRGVIPQEVDRAVADARADGVTWAKIGDALGVTHQAVIKRYGRGGGR